MLFICYIYLACISVLWGSGFYDLDMWLFRMVMFPAKNGWEKRCRLALKQVYRQVKGICWCYSEKSKVMYEPLI